MNRRKLLKRLSEGRLKNVAFGDMINMVEGFGFRLARVSGSHHIYTNPEIPELVNLQEVKGEAKPYQIRQFLRLVERYNLTLEDEI
jgi:predicted RNA binding protein YcfA (HicA-like mRNA interferase family)